MRTSAYLMSFAYSTSWLKKSDIKDVHQGLFKCIQQVLIGEKSQFQGRKDNNNKRRRHIKNEFNSVYFWHCEA